MPSMIYRIPIIFLLSVTVLHQTPCAMAQRSAIAESVEVTILSSNLANFRTVGEWGFSALVEVDGRCILFDAGNKSDTVMRNIEALDVDLSCVTDVVLSHFHFDHMGGLVTLFNHTRSANPDAMQRVHVASGFFLSRTIPSVTGDAELNQMIAVREQLEAEGVEFKVYSEATEILPAVWLTGPVTRSHPEKNYPSEVRVHMNGEWVEDYVPDSQGLVIATADGPIVLLGCGHSGTVNLLEQVQHDVQDLPIQALMGGMHLYNASDSTLEWTARKLSDIGVKHLMAGHCTGIEPMFRLRNGLGLTRHTAVIGAVGSRFVLGEGIHPTEIAQ